MRFVVVHASQQAAATSGVFWASILASATVALVTTLLIEYLAKPWLEVRKDRILARSQQRRTVLRGLERACFIAGRLTAFRDQQSIELFRDRAIRFAVEAEPLVMAAHDELEAPSKLAGDWMDTAAAVEGFMVWLRTETPPDEVWNDFAEKLKSWITTRTCSQRQAGAGGRGASSSARSCPCLTH
jgi:hypothetical protein